jgi:hypothetical protein
MTEAYSHREESAVATLTTTGIKFTLTPAVPIDIIRWGVIANALIDVGAGMILQARKRPTAGSATGESVVGTLSTGTTDIAAGTLFNDELAAPVQIDPGQDFVVDATDAADTAGTGFIYAIFRIRGFQPGQRPATGKVIEG